jgi:hypothetical protein
MDTHLAKPIGSAAGVSGLPLNSAPSKNWNATGSSKASPMARRKGSWEFSALGPRRSELLAFVEALPEPGTFAHEVASNKDDHEDSHDGDAEEKELASTDPIRMLNAWLEIFCSGLMRHRSSSSRWSESSTVGHFLELRYDHAIYRFRGTSPPA